MVQVFLFSTGGLRCAMPLADIQSVIQMVAIEPSPDIRRGLVGTVNIHGGIVPVFSLRDLFGIPSRPPRLTDMLVIAQAMGETIGIWVDQIQNVEDLIFPPGMEPSGKGGSAQTLRISITPEGIVFISDIGAVLLHPLDKTELAAITTLQSRKEDTPGSIQEDEDPDPETTRTILAERALKMLPAEPGLLTSEITEVLRFQLAYRQYALEMKYVREVIITGEITPVPGTPDFISGICAVRGQIISLVDLRALFKIPEKGLTDLNRVIVITNGKITFGILADSIRGVGIISLDRVSPPNSGDLSGRCRYFKGTLDQDDLYVLNAETILGDPAIIVDDL